MRGIFKKISVFALLLVFVAMAAMFASCGRNGDDPTPADDPAPADTVADDTAPADDDADDPAPVATGWDNHITIDVFHEGGPGFIGMQTGWFAQMIEERFNMSVNHIASPDGDADVLFATRSAAGNLGDMIYIHDRRIPDTIHVGLLYDITELVENNMPYYTQYFPTAVARARRVSDRDGRIFAIPTLVSTQLPTDPALDGFQIDRSPYLRQDLYFAIGAPTMYVLEDLLDVLEAMHEINPISFAGTPVWPINLFGSWDSATMANNTWWDRMYGLAPGVNGNVWYDLETREIQTIFDEDGFYLRGLRLYFEANQRGLINPDSPTLYVGDFWNHLGYDGQYLFSWYSWLGLDNFRTPERTAQGIGFNFIPIMDQRIVVPGIAPHGSGTFIGVGANAEDPARIIAFIDWMSSPEGHQAIYTGPEGLTWEMINGEPHMTDFGFEAGVHVVAFEDVAVPAEFGGGGFNTGGWQGSSMILRWRGREMNPATGHPYDPRHWASLAPEVTDFQRQWQEHFGAENQLDFLQQHGMLIGQPPIDFTAPIDPSDIDLIRGEVRAAIVPASWRMVFAADEAEFNQIWNDLVNLAHGLGWEQVRDFDIEIAHMRFAAYDAMLGQ